MDGVGYHVDRGTLRAKRPWFEEGYLQEVCVSRTLMTVLGMVWVVYLDVPVRVKLFREAFA